MYSLGIPECSIRTIHLGLSNYFNLPMLSKLMTVKNFHSEDVAIILNNALKLKKIIKVINFDDASCIKQIEQIKTYLISIGGKVEDINLALQSAEE